jgi:type I restriction enzyme R subunit
LTSFKTARLLSKTNDIDKVLFVVDRQDLDFQTMKEYEKFEKGAANATKNTLELEQKLASEKYEDKIAITTIQKLNIFINKYKNHLAFNKKIVLIFDECHRSQFGEFHRNIVKHFKNYFIFGFTGTPIFKDNRSATNRINLQTTEQAFGECLHKYTIIEAIGDGNVLPFKVEHINTIKKQDNINDYKINDIKNEQILLAPERISNIVKYILDNFNRKTQRNEFGDLKNKRNKGFNSIFCVDSIEAAKSYYLEFKKQQENKNDKLIITTIFSFAPNEDNDTICEESLETTDLNKTSRDFLDLVINEYNICFKTKFSTDGDGFSNYYKEISERMKKKEIDLLIVVNMFLTGFDAKTLNTL